ncbi:MAG: efflux RND transporter periplasmic adaptor subunit [Anaerolineales bacterium]|jgi:HlyD family secretion protein
MNRNTIIILVVILVVLIAVGYFVTEPEAGQQLLVELGLAEPAHSGYQAVGMLEASVYSLSSEAGGFVQSFPLEEGAAVQSGQVLAVLDDRLQQAAYEAASARLEAAQATVAMIEDGLRPVDLAVLEAIQDQAQAAVDGAQFALEQAQDLPAGENKDRQVAQAEAALEAAQAGLDAAQAALDAAEEGASQAERDAAQAGMDAAQQALTQAQTALEGQTITAPVDGVVLEHRALPGEWVAPGSTVVRLADLSTLEITVYLPVDDMGWVGLDDAVQLVADAYPDRVFNGRVIYIADQAEFTPRNVQTPEERTILVYAVRIEVDNQENLLKPGLWAEVTFGGEG